MKLPNELSEWLKSEVNPVNGELNLGPDLAKITIKWVELLETHVADSKKLLEYFSKIKPTGDV